MNNRTILYLVMFLLLASCGNGMKEKVVSKHDNGQPAKVYYFDKNNRCVREVDYYETGIMMMEGPVKNDLRDGEWTSYFPDGKVQSTGIYQDGVRTGKALVYHENGHLWMDGFYKNDQKSGLWIYYDEQGYEFQRVDYGE